MAGGKKREPLDQRGRGQHSPLQFKACAQISSVKTYNYVFPFQGQVLGLRAKPPCTVAFSRVDKLVQILTAVLQKTGMIWVTCGESADNAGIVQLTGSMSQARPWLSWERGGTDVRRKNNSLFSLELEASKHANTETDQEDGVERSRIYLLSQVHQNHNSAQKPLMEKTRTSQERSSTKKNLKKSTMRWQGGMDLQHNQV